MRGCETSQTGVRLTPGIDTPQSCFACTDGFELGTPTLRTFTRIQVEKQSTGEISEVVLIDFGMLCGKKVFGLLAATGILVWFGILVFGKIGSVGGVGGGLMGRFGLGSCRGRLGLTGGLWLFQVGRGFRRFCGIVGIGGLAFRV
mgnify:CR=1 FL=1